MQPSLLSCLHFDSIPCNWTFLYLTAVKLLCGFTLPTQVSHNIPNHNSYLISYIYKIDMVHKKNITSKEKEDINNKFKKILNENSGKKMDLKILQK